MGPSWRFLPTPWPVRVTIGLKPWSLTVTSIASEISEIYLPVLQTFIAFFNANLPQSKNFWIFLSGSIAKLNEKYPDIANRRYDPKDIPDDASKEYAAYYAYFDKVIGDERLDNPELDAQQYSIIKNELDEQFIITWAK